MAGCEITTVYTGIAGGHIKAFPSHGVVAVKDKEVRQQDVDRVIDQAKAVAIPLDREVIHVLPQEFIVDDQGGIREPLGMTGARLEAKVHIVTGAVASAQNIIKCANRAGLNVSDIVLQPLASSEAVLTEEEKELGVCLVDIGGGTTDIAIFQNGAIVHTAVIALGGHNLTNDIAVGLRTPIDHAERLKQKFGCSLTAMVDKSEMIEVPVVAEGALDAALVRQLWTVADFIAIGPEIWSADDPAAAFQRLQPALAIAAQAQADTRRLQLTVRGIEIDVFQVFFLLLRLGAHRRAAQQAIGIGRIDQQFQFDFHGCGNQSPGEARPAPGPAPAGAATTVLKEGS